jgi:endonuclease/exonuclease/phosphatase (EEP) superfamily protein YafD
MYLIVLLGIWLALQFGDSWWPSTVLMFSPRWAFALPVVVLLPAAVFLHRRSALILLVVALIACGPVAGFNVPWQRLTQSTPSGMPLRVVTLNMHNSKVDAVRLERLIAEVDPDVVAVQEWPQSDRSTLNETTGWHVHRTPRLFLASRFPIRAVTELGHDSTGEHASVTMYELNTVAGPVHVFSLHAATARQGISDLRAENGKGPDEIRFNSSRRREQSEYIASKATTCTGPVVIVGDFNTPPESILFPEVWSSYTDAFSVAGWGWGYTFIGAKTTVRIDHVLTGAGWRCTSCRVGPNVGSPHRPVIADLVWTGESAVVK